MRRRLEKRSYIPLPDAAGVDATICVRILLHVSSFCYICVRILLYVSAYYYICVLILLHVSSYYYMSHPTSTFRRRPRAARPAPFRILLNMLCVLILHLPLAARPALFRINLEGIELSEDLDLHTLAAKTEGYSGSNITPKKNSKKTNPEKKLEKNKNTALCFMPYCSRMPYALCLIAIQGRTSPTSAATLL
jgi:hypothetical protein